MNGICDFFSNIFSTKPDPIKDTDNAILDPVVEIDDKNSMRNNAILDPVVEIDDKDLAFTIRYATSNNGEVISAIFDESASQILFISQGSGEVFCVDYSNDSFNTIPCGTMSFLTL